MSIGAAEDAVKKQTLVSATTHMRLTRLAGFDSIRITSIWSPGQKAPPALERKLLANVQTAARLNGIKVFVSVHHVGSRTTPLTDTARADFARYAAALAKGFPLFRDIIVGNEPNLNRFWMPQFNLDGSDAAAPAYLALLAQTYDTLKRVSRKVTVIGGALSRSGADNPAADRHTHSPTTFIRDLGDAYRESGRARPIMDQFAHHPYADKSTQPPTFRHTNTRTITLADYGKLVALLGRAFDGTAQPGSTMPIVYAEYGYQARIPAHKAKRYKDREQATINPISEKLQGTFYRQAIQLSFCQPNVRALILFHAFDEPSLIGWQSGLYYADRTPKTNLQLVRGAMDESRRGVIARCEGLELAVKAKVRFPASPSTNGDPAALTLTCDLDCTYVARIEQLPAEKPKPVRSLRGRAVAATATKLLLPGGAPLKPGRYRFAVEVAAALNPGVPAVVLGKPFSAS